MRSRYNSVNEYMERCPEWVKDLWDSTDTKYVERHLVDGGEEDELDDDTDSESDTE